MKYFKSKIWFYIIYREYTYIWSVLESKKLILINPTRLHVTFFIAILYMKNDKNLMG